MAGPRQRWILITLRLKGRIQRLEREMGFDSQDTAADQKLRRRLLVARERVAREERQGDKAA